MNASAVPLAVAAATLLLTVEALAEPASGCALGAADSDHATSASCEACHPQGRAHPVDLAYRDVAARNPSRLADADAVLRAGVRLPDGRIRCVTCHDRASPWRYQLALPPGAAPEPSFRSTRGRPADLSGPRPRPGGGLPPGAEVTPTPLCRVCHLF